MNLYVVLELTKTIDIDIDGAITNVPLSYLEGMVGALPVFESEEAAKKYAGQRSKILTITSLQ